MGLVDVHVHLAALPSKDNGCLLSLRMRRSPLTRLIAWKQGLPLDDPERANRLYLERLEAELGRSKLVERAVLLGMDGVYGSDGRLDEAHTDFLISNDAVFAAVKNSRRFMAGVSINPARRGAVDELDRCRAQGAVLVKVLPNAQAFDPAEPRLRPFYRRAGELGLPILTHVGFEYSLIGQDQSVGDLSRWRPALEEGAAVIAAHGCSTGLFLAEKHLATMSEFVRRYRGFYVDTSALTLPNRVGALLRLRRMPEVFDRLIFGTDYPLAVFSYPCLFEGSLSGYCRAASASNRFDRQAHVLKVLGLPLGRDFQEVFQRAR